MLEWFTVSGFRFGLDVIRGAFRISRGRRGRITPAKKLELRQKFEPGFQDYFTKQVHQKCDTELVIRDIKRMDQYPNVEMGKRKGISPWFRVNMLQTYDRGFIVAVRYGNLIEDEQSGKWRHADYKKEKGTRTVLAGFIPYENVEGIVWEGDKYYGSPQVFCYFDGPGKMPYEKFEYSQVWDFDGIPQLRHIAERRDVLKESRLRKVPSFD